MTIATPRSSVQLEEWSSPEVLDHLRVSDRLVIIPLGSFEQHGPHAPLGTDTFICYEICLRLARKLNGVTVPPVWFSVSEEHMDFAGTITISPETFCNYMSDIILSLERGGFRKILVLNGHGTNESYFPLIQAKVEKGLSGEGELEVLFLSYWTALPPNERDYLGSLKWGLHANAFETSLILAILPELVKNIKNSSHFPDVSGLDVNDLDAVLFRSLIEGSNGVWGDPTNASVEKGESLLARIESSLANILTAALKLSGAESISKDTAHPPNGYSF